jgi:hypothetical protein
MPLSAEEIARLVSKKASTGGVKGNRLTDADTDFVEIKVKPIPCAGCGEPRDANGYCTNTACAVDAVIPTFPCKFCGHCSTPNKCVKSVECPECLSQAGDLCEVRGKPVAFHEDRWLLVQELYGTYYKSKTIDPEHEAQLRLLEKLGLRKPSV